MQKTYQLTDNELFIIRKLQKYNLDKLFLSGNYPTHDTLNGYFLGCNLNPLTKIIGIRRFIKKLDKYEGCNIMVSQFESKEKYVILENKQKRQAKTQGYFHIIPNTIHKGVNSYKIDYNHTRNSFFEPGRLVEDFIVEVKFEGETLLLGRGIVKALKWIDSYFILFHRSSL